MTILFVLLIEIKVLKEIEIVFSNTTIEFSIGITTCGVKPIVDILLLLYLISINDPLELIKPKLPTDDPKIDEITGPAT